MRRLLAAVIAVFVSASFAEAAGTAVRHRPRHSSRVTSGSSESAPASSKKKTARKKKSTKTSARKTSKKAPPSTKPK